MDSVKWNPPTLPEHKLWSVSTLAAYSYALGQELASAYRHRSRQPNRFPRSMQDFLSLVVNVYPDQAFPVWQVSADPAASVVDGFYIATKSDGAPKELEGVYVNPKTDPKALRFALCREALMLLPTHDVLRTGEISDSLRDEAFRTLQGRADNKPLRRAFPSSAGEIVAEVAAMEFLFPLSERLFCIIEGRSPAGAADAYGVPPDLAEFYMSDKIIRYLQELSR